MGVEGGGSEAKEGAAGWGGAWEVGGGGGGGPGCRPNGPGRAGGGTKSRSWGRKATWCAARLGGLTLRLIGLDHLAGAVVDHHRALVVGDGRPESVLDDHEFTPLVGEEAFGLPASVPPIHLNRS